MERRLVVPAERRLVVPQEPCFKTKEKMEEFLANFQEPGHKRQRELRQEQRKREQNMRKRQKLHEQFMSEKLLAKDCFNVPPCAEQLAAWHAHWKCPSKEPQWLLPGTEDQESDSEWLAVRLQTTFVPSEADVTAARCIYDFFTMADHCRQWLQQRLHDMGWSSNQTGYDPVAVSYSVPELLHATWQCYCMAVKQTHHMLQSWKGFQ